MTRLRQAWLALTGRLEPEVREVRVPVFGEASMLDVYQIYTGGFTPEGRHELAYFRTCEQAHAVSPSAAVSKVRAVRIGDEYWFARDYVAIKLQPKPKVAKGARRG